MLERVERTRSQESWVHLLFDIGLVVHLRLSFLLYKMGTIILTNFIGVLGRLRH